MDPALNADLTEHDYMFALPCYDGKMHCETAIALIQVCEALTRMQVKHRCSVVKGNPLIAAARNNLARNFLDSTCDTLIFIDSDISFDWEAMSRLLVYSHHYPLVSGAYTCKEEPPRFTLTLLEETKLNADDLLPVMSIGIGFTAIQRKVFEAMSPPTYADAFKREVKAYFQTAVEEGQYLGEDFYFFRQCVKHGFLPHIDPGIRLGHMGQRLYEASFPIEEVLRQGL